MLSKKGTKMKSPLRKTFSFAPGFDLPSFLISDHSKSKSQSHINICKNNSNCCLLTDKMEMDRKNFLKEKKVLTWTVDQVTRWVSHLRFSQKIVNAFSEARVDGDILLQIEESNLKEDLQMKNGIDRKRFLRELNALKREADYTSRDKHNMDDFLVNNLGEEYKVYSYNLISHDFSVDLMRRLSANDLHDMLKEAGVNNSIHRCKIVEVVETVSAERDDSTSSFDSMLGSSISSCSLTDNINVNPNEPVYVSYPKTRSGSELASLVAMQLRLRGFAVHTADSTQGSHENALEIIRMSRNFVVVLSAGALDESEVFLHREIVTALESGCNVVPVVDEFQFPEAETLSEELRPVCSFNAVKWIHDYQTACIDKLERFLRGESWYNSSLLNTANGRKLSGGSGGRSPCKSQHLSPVLAIRNRSVSRVRTISSDSSTIGFF